MVGTSTIVGSLSAKGSEYAPATTIGTNCDFSGGTVKTSPGGVLQALYGLVVTGGSRSTIDDNLMIHAGNIGDYAAVCETGTFTLTYSEDSSKVFSGYKYVKIGSLVVVYGNVNGPLGGVTIANGKSLTGLPFSIQNGGYNAYCYLGTNTSNTPVNLCTSKKVQLSSTSIMLTEDYVVQLGQPVMLFGIYLTSQ